MMKKLLMFVIAAFACGSVAIAQTPSPFQPQELLSMVQLGGSSQIAISPDGQQVAYVTADPAGVTVTTAFDPRGPGRKAVWVVDVNSSTVRRISNVRTDAWSPVWSPDSRRLAFYTGNDRSGRLVIWNSATGTIQATSVVIASPVATFGTAAARVTWLDATELIIPQPVRSTSSSGDSSTPKPTPTPAISVFIATPPPASTGLTGGHIITAGLYRDTPTLNLELFDRSSGIARVIARHTQMTGLQLSPDGRRLLYLTNKGEIDSDVNSREIFDVGIVDLQSGVSRIVAANVLTTYGGDSFSWSHDGSKIAFIGGWIPGDMEVTTAEHGSSFPGHCYVIDPNTPGPPHRLGGDLLLARSQGPLFWSQDDSTLYATDEAHTTIYAIFVTSGLSKPLVSLNDGTFTFHPHLFIHVGAHHYVQAVSDTGERRLYDVHLEDGTMNLVFHAYQGMTDVTFSSDGTHAAYIGQDPRRPPDVWATENGFASTRQLTHLNPQIEARALGNAEDVAWKTRSGLALNGVLLLPAGYQMGRRYPTITWVYGGEPEGSNSRASFGLSLSTQSPYFNLQLFASRGYAVFVPNSVLHVGTPMSDLADDVLPGIDQVVTMGVADPNRLGIYGQSYGGYSTLALLVQSDRFKAAVAMSGIDDIFAMFGTMYNDGTDWTSWSESQQGRMGGTPWEQRQRYIDNSPFFFFDKVHTPVLLEYGANDRFAAINMEQTFVSLRRLGQTVELVRYADEGHVLMKPSNQLDLCNRILAWFHTYLQ